MIVKPSSVFLVQRPGPGQFFLDSGVIQLGGVLHEQDHRVRFHPLQSCPAVWGQNLMFIDRIAIEKLIGGMGFCPAVTGAVDARLGIGGKPFQDMLATLVQTPVSQINACPFIVDPTCLFGAIHRRGPPWSNSVVRLPPASVPPFSTQRNCTRFMLATPATNLSRDTYNHQA